MAITQVTKAEFARILGISRARVTQYTDMGMPMLSDGTLDLAACRVWVKSNVRLWNNKWHDRGAFALSMGKRPRRGASR